MGAKIQRAWAYLTPFPFGKAFGAQGDAVGQPQGGHGKP
jgi:hypothetical protein